MIPTLNNLAAVALVSVGNHFLAQAKLVSTAPKDAVGAEALTAAFALLEARARVAQDQLVACVAAVAWALSLRKKQVAAVRAAEKTLDSTFAALCDRLLGEVKEGSAGSSELVALLCPDGSYVFTRFSGRPQLAKYLAWLHAATSAAALSNPAYGAVADKIGSFKGKVASFEGTIQEKDRLSADLEAARAECAKAQAAWIAAFQDLMGTGALMQGAESAAFRAWIKPLLDVRTTRAAKRTRAANAKQATQVQAPAEPPAPTVEVVEGGDAGG